MVKLRESCLSIMFAVCVILPAACVAADWPAWRGADRTGVSSETGLLRSWPADGPKLLWKATGIGEGYATPSVAFGKVFVMGSKAGEEYVLALDVESGKQAWSTRVGLVGENRGPNYPGPRSTPTVEKDLLYTLGSDGDLVCLRTESGKLVWRRHLEKDFEGSRGTWAYTESPLIDGEVLVCTPGGRRATLLALNKKNGAILWQAVVPGGNQAGYASAVVARIGNSKQYVQFIGRAVVGIDARDGKFLWEYGRHIGGVSAATPVFHDGCIFSSSSAASEDAGGDALIRLTLKDGKPGIQEAYFGRVMNNSHGGVIRVDSCLYGTNRTGLVCMDFKTGTKRWANRCVGSGSLMAADGHLYVRGTDGAMALVEANADRYLEKGRFRQPERSRFATFAHPVVAGGRLFLRDADLLFCFGIAAKS